MSTVPPFGRWLKQRRAALDLTQEALAEQVGCAPQTIRKIEAGERRPSQQMAERLAIVLDVPAAERPSFVKAARTTHDASGVPPVLDRSKRRPTLPTYTTPFVGRAAELAQLGELLADPDTQLLTLLGPGGIGKTRLAVEAARHSTQFEDGVVFVALAQVSSAALLVPTIADALGFSLSGTEEPPAELITYLLDKHMLLILDNVEHLLDGSRWLGELIKAAPRTKFLVTSRERLNLQGEWVVELRGLPVDEAAAEAAAGADAVALFLERARRVQHNIVLSDADRASIVEICRLVDGMPLGIELAASWVRLLSFAEIAAEMRQSFDFLQASTRDMPGRHHSLRAVFDHSWHLLSARERNVLRQLAVFRGGFGRAAAAEVAQATLPVLAALVDKSLLRRSSAARYELHELVRQYAAEHLAADAADDHAVHQRHASYFAGWLDERENSVKGPDQSTVIAELSAEIDNLRAAWHWSATHQQLDALRRALPTLHWFYEFRTWFGDGEALFAQAAAGLELAYGRQPATGSEAASVLGMVLGSHGYFLSRVGSLDRAWEQLERSLALLRGGAWTGPLSSTLLFCGMVAFQRGHYTEAQRFIEECIELATERQGYWNLALARLFPPLIAHARGEYAEAERLFRDDLKAWRAVGSPRGLSLCLNYFSTTLFMLGQHAEAQALLHESLALCSASDDHWSFGTALHHLGLIAMAQGEHDQAIYLFSESLALFAEMGSRWDRARTLHHLGAAHLALGHMSEAAEHLRRAALLAAAIDARPDLLAALAALAQWLFQAGQRERAVIVATTVANDPAADHSTRAAVGLLRAKLEAQMTSQELARAHERATAMSVELVLAELVPVTAEP